MFDMFGSVRALLKLDRVCTDNNVFRLHYKATVILLVVFSLLVTSKQYFGEPIECVLGRDTAPSQRAINSYCWIHSTFTVVRPERGEVGLRVPHPGVDRHVQGEDAVTYHKYYQWVCFMLFFQAVLFSAPHHLWKVWEGGRLRMLSLDLGSPLVGASWSDERKRLLTDYMMEARGPTHAFYALRFAACELLNFVNAVCQIFFLDLFLGGAFARYGPAIALWGPGGARADGDPMDRAFPKVTKCTFHYFGPSGSIQRLDALCILPLNIVNEKIFLVLWFWYAALSALSALALAYRAAVAADRRCRAYLLMAQARFLAPGRVRALTARMGYGDWFFLRQLGKNLNPVVFRELLLQLEGRLLASGKAAA